MKLQEMIPKLDILSVKIRTAFTLFNYSKRRYILAGKVVGFRESVITRFQHTFNFFYVYEMESFVNKHGILNGTYELACQKVYIA